MSASHASLTDIPAADVAHTDAKWTPVRNHFGIIGGAFLAQRRCRRARHPD